MSNQYVTTLDRVVLPKVKSFSAFNNLMRNGKIRVNHIKMIDRNEALYKGDLVHVDRETIQI